MKTVENYKSFLIRRCIRRTVIYPVKNVPILIPVRRFGGVGALEGLKNVPEIYTIFFCKVRKSVFLVEDVGITPIFPQKADFSAKIVKPREVTCDVLTEVEG